MEDTILNTKSAMGRKKVLLVGPLPPPVGGATMTFQTFVDAWTEKVPVATSVLNTSPRYLRLSNRLTFQDILRGVTLGARLWLSAARHDAVLLFSTSGFYIRFSGVLSLLRRHVGTRVTVSFFGSYLADAIMKLPKGRRASVLEDLRTLHCVIVETDFLRQRLEAMGVSNAVTVPGYRRIDYRSLPDLCRCSRRGLRIVYLGQVRREKGIFVLLDALSVLAQSRRDVTCDIYGPVDPMLFHEFQTACARIPNVAYRGVADGYVPNLLAQYDVLVLPTWHSGEGHPGVIIEAMIAGIPVIASRFRAIPELVVHQENGLLVDPGSVENLVDALSFLANNPLEVARMGRAHRQRLGRHDVFAAVHNVYNLMMLGDCPVECSSNEAMMMRR